MNIGAFNQIANAEDACSSGSTLSRWNDGTATAISRGRPSRTHGTENRAKFSRGGGRAVLHSPEHDVIGGGKLNHVGG